MPPKKEWARCTRQLPRESIPAELAAAIQEHLTAYNLGPILDDYQVCIETVSEKTKRSLFDLLLGGSRHRAEVAILTPRWLVVATRGVKPDSAAALSVQLKDAVVQDHAGHPGYQLLPDTGLHVTGVFTGRVGTQGSQRISYYLGLGEEPAANEFKARLLQAIERTRL